MLSLSDIFNSERQYDMSQLCTICRLQTKHNESVQCISKLSYNMLELLVQMPSSDWMRAGLPQHFIG